jgi:hypothetical protein
MLHGIALLTAAVIATANARAGYAYRFDDDAVTGASLDAQGSSIRDVRQAERDVLIRPRLSFLPELLKSVENL